MIPQSFAALYSFLGLVAPGLVFQVVRERRRPVLEETAFREASRIALTSLVFTTAAILLISVVSLAYHPLMPDVAAWISSGGSYLRQHFEAVVLAVFVEVSLACLLSAVVCSFMGDRGFQKPSWKIFRKPIMGKSSIWHQVLRSEVEPDYSPWVRISLADGTRLWGYAHLYSTSRKTDEKELLLIGPGLAYKRKGGKKKEMESDHNFISIKAADIVMMQITHVPKESPDGSRPQSNDARKQEVGGMPEEDINKVALKPVPALRAILLRPGVRQWAGREQ